MRNGRRQHLLIADTQFLFRRGLRTLFNGESDLEVMGEVSTVEEALAAARDEKLDAVVMNMALVDQTPEANIFEARQLQASAPILFLAEVESQKNLNIVMTVGAFGYLLKSTAPAQIVATVRRACLGDKPEAENLANTANDLRALAVSNDAYGRGTTVLTAREQEILRLLAEGRTVRESAVELALSIKTVEAHKLNLMRKLDIHNRATLIEYAIAKGVIQAAVA